MILNTVSKNYYCKRVSSILSIQLNINYLHVYLFPDQKPFFESFNGYVGLLNLIMSVLLTFDLPMLGSSSPKTLFSLEEYK